MVSYRNFDRRDGIFLFAILIMRIGLGFYATMFGLSILDLAKHIGVSQQAVSLVVTR